MLFCDVQLHPGLPKMEKRKISSLMDVKKLSKGACIHAAQNDRLPLRVVVQVLFFEQLRAAGAAAATPNLSVARCMARLAEEEEDDDHNHNHWKEGRALPEPPTPGALKRQMGSLKLSGDGGDDGRRLVARSSSVANQSSRLSLSSRSRRIFDRLWVGGGTKLPGEAGAATAMGKVSSDTSGSSQSPRSSAKPLESKSSSSSSRNRRYSVS